MTEFADLLREFAAKVERRTQTVFLNTVSAAHESITIGSAVTGSPGQPVGQYGPGYHPGEVGGELDSSLNGARHPRNPPEATGRSRRPSP